MYLVRKQTVLDVAPDQSTKPCIAQHGQCAREAFVDFNTKFLSELIVPLKNTNTTQMADILILNGVTSSTL